MVVGVSLLCVVRRFLARIVTVAVDQRRVVVLMAVVMRPVLELTQRATGVVMRHVVVVVGMALRLVGVLLLHGLCGCHHSPYMRRLAWKLLRHGLRAVRMNLRGCGSGRGLARYPYHSGRSADVLAGLDSLYQEAPASPVTLVGFSLGGNIVLKLAGELSVRVPENLQRVIAVCPPADLVACSRALDG